MPDHRRRDFITFYFVNIFLLINKELGLSYDANSHICITSLSDILLTIGDLPVLPLPSRSHQPNQSEIQSLNMIAVYYHDYVQSYKKRQKCKKKQLNIVS